MQLALEADWPRRRLLSQHRHLSVQCWWCSWSTRQTVKRSPEGLNKAVPCLAAWSCLLCANTTRRDGCGFDTWLVWDNMYRHLSLSDTWNGDAQRTTLMKKDQLTIVTYSWLSINWNNVHQTSTWRKLVLHYRPFLYLKNFSLFTFLRYFSD